jgi:PqqD family protein of HPr-rel-A system
MGIDQLLWEQFDDEYFVFNPASGHTHVLNALGAATLQQLAGEPLTADELLARLQAQVGADGSEALHQALPEHLSQLAAIGLIEQLP